MYKQPRFYFTRNANIALKILAHYKHAPLPVLLTATVWEKSWLLQGSTGVIKTFLRQSNGLSFRNVYAVISFGLTHITQLMTYHTYQIWESSRIGSFDFVKNSLAADPEILKQFCLILFWTFRSKGRMQG